MTVKASPNVVPLCDILLVLLIIFMVISPMAQEGMDINMPEVGKGNAPVIVLSIEANGMYNLNSQPFDDLKSLEIHMRNVFDNRTAKTIYFQAHDDVAYQKVIDAIDSAKAAGVETVCMKPYREQRREQEQK